MNKVEEKQTSFTNLEKNKTCNLRCNIKCTCLVIWKIRFLRYAWFSNLSNILISIRWWMILEEAIFDNGSLDGGVVQMATTDLKFNCLKEWCWISNATVYHCDKLNTMKILGENKAADTNGVLVELTQVFGVFLSGLEFKLL